MGSAAGRRAENRWEADDPYGEFVAQRNEDPAEQGASVPDASTGDRWRPPIELIERLRPWIDIDAVGPEGWHTWLETIVAILPLPKGGPLGVPEPRIESLARAVADGASARARAHFLASEYYRDNVALATRVKALEAILRTSRKPIPPPTVAEAKATERYLPPEEGP